MACLDNLPLELIYSIIDAFNPIDYVHDYTNALNILRLSRVNHLFNEVLSQDPEFYERLWKKYISANLPNVSPMELRNKYFHTLRNLESQKDNHSRLCLAVDAGYTCVFDALFRLSDFTKKKDVRREARIRRYHDDDEELENDDDDDDNDEEIDIDAEDDNENVENEDFYNEEYKENKQDINTLFISSVARGDLYMMERLADGVVSEMIVYTDVLHIAIRNGHLHLLKRLKERFPNATHSPLIITASEYGHLNIVNFLVELGEDVTAYHNMAVSHALIHQHYEVAKRLIELGADATDGQALRYAGEHGHIETVRLVVRPEVNDTFSHHQALISASRHGYTEIVDLLLSINVDPQAPKGNSRPLYEASYNGHLDVVNLLLKKDIPPDTIGIACCATIRKKYYNILERLLETNLDEKIIKKIYDVVIKEKALGVMYRLAKEGSRGAINILRCYDSSFKITEVNDSGEN